MAREVRHVRFSDEEWERVVAGAEAAGLRPSTYVRESVLMVAGRAVEPGLAVAARVEFPKASLSPAFGWDKS